MNPSSSERAIYYRAALSMLRFAEARSSTGRRFGPDADARWGHLAGGLRSSDRIDLLLRDADAEWPGAFAARTVFDLSAVAEDDAFGAHWVSLDAVAGERAWRDANNLAPAATVEAAIAQVCAAWELMPARHEVPRWTAGARLLVGGAGAILATVQAFAANADLNWCAQVIVVADRPAERQLGALAAMWLGTTSATVLRRSAELTEPEVAATLRGFAPAISDDASGEVRQAVAAASGGKA